MAIDYLNGAVVELGPGLGVAAPLNQVVVNILKAKEITPGLVDIKNHIVTLYDISEA